MGGFWYDEGVVGCWYGDDVGCCTAPEKYSCAAMACMLQRLSSMKEAQEFSNEARLGYIKILQESSCRGRALQIDHLTSKLG